MTGALDGITVVEFGQFVSVPFCGQLMADAGARVIKVEPPGGDSYRSSHELAPGESRQFAIKNRGKESVALDLGHPDAGEVVRRLAALADVVLVNMSPAAVARRGLDAATLSAVNPRLVHGAVTGYGTVGPDAGLPGMDVVVQAHSGLVAALGAEADGVPRHSEVQVADYASSLLLLAGVSMALVARDRTGRGQPVDVSLLGAALTLQNNQFSHVDAVDGWRAAFVADELPRLRRAGAGRDRIAAAREAHQPDRLTLTGHYRVFGTADGAIAVGAGSPPTQERLAAIAGMPVDRLRTGTEAVRADLAALFVTRDSAEWVTRLREVAIPCAVVRALDEVLTDPHVEAEGLVADVEHPAIGRYRGLGAPIRFGGTPSEPTRPSPPFAAHTTAVLDELGFTPAEARRLLRSGAAVARPRRTDDRSRSSA
ncbi:MULTISPECIES: CoA transferase [unclassified Pseudonocardia]|uniref:CaiB/BaiF CoA transferase family protein n=1 Tax=unclassified Pseudonocardia TaxID=2619320 RepID=UPI0001FFE9AB|nr:CoA transferase [Pseudonocardia sp. Ae707_Ps1]OLM18476.1 CAIB/BAIF family protein [Pseudonocardia sp. Ae707_Ps1]